MGIDTESARFLMQSHREGCRFDRVLTLGRQEYFLGGVETSRLLREFGHAHSLSSEKANPVGHRHAEPFFRVLGAKVVDSMDASEYEGATLIHDLNRPIAPELEQRFEAVCDVGTLEHVFQCTIGIASCLKMVKPGGHFYAFTPGNNYCGHGFYQFSPELFFRILRPENGFQMERMVAVEYGPGRRWYEVTDPEVIRDRVRLINAYPVLLFLRARKTQHMPLDVFRPQQSDYSAAWKGVQSNGIRNKLYPATAGGSPLKKWLLENAPGLCRGLENFFVARLSHRFSFRNRIAFRRRPK